MPIKISREIHYRCPKALMIKSDPEKSSAQWTELVVNRSEIICCDKIRSVFKLH